MKEGEYTPSHANMSLKDHVAIEVLKGLYSYEDPQTQHVNDQQTIREWQHRIMANNVAFALRVADEYMGQRKQ